MIKLIRVIKTATSAQAIFNAVTASNPYVLAATAIAAIATSIWSVKSASDAFKGSEEVGLLGDISGMTLEQTKKALKDVKASLKMYQDIINNPDTEEATRKSLDAYVEALEKQITDLEVRISKLGGKIEFEGLQGDGDKDEGPFAKFTEELTKFEDALEQVAVNGFKKMEDAIFNFVTTGKLAFKDLVTSVLHDLTRLIIRQSITKPLFSMFTGLWSKDGNAFASNNIVPYAKGGVVNKPTMFKYGGSKLGVMGEAGPEAILPLQLSLIHI